MRIAILSDIHANLPAFEAVLTTLKPFAIDAIIVNGDCINAGPFPVEVLQIIQQNNMQLIRGNHEQYILDCAQAPEDFPRPQWAPVHWTCEQLDSTSLDYLNRTPDMLLFDNLLIVHGAPGYLSGGIIPGTSDIDLLSRYGTVTEASTVITGHTHLPFSVRWRDKLIVNTGSVGLSLDGNTAAAYLIATQKGHDWTLQPQRASYDAGPLEKAFHVRGLFDTGVMAQLFLREMLTANIFVYPYIKRMRTAGLNIKEAAQKMPPSQALPDLDYGLPHWNL